MKDLTLKMKLERSQVKKELEATEGELGKVKAKAKEAGEGIEKGLGDGAKKSGQHMQDMGKTGVSALGSIVTNLTAATIGFGTLLKLANGFNDAINKAAETSRQLASKFVQDRDKLRDLANVMGEKADTAFALKQAQFNANARITPEEGRDFRSGFWNGGAQFRGNKMTNEQFSKFEQNGAALMAAKGIELKTGGDFLGSVTGMRDWSKMKDGDKQALGVANSQLAILGAGGGDIAPMVRQLKMVNAGLTNEDAMKGAFQDPNQAAALTSVLAENNPENAGVETKAVVRGLRGFNGKQGALLKRAGITPQMDEFTALKNLYKVVNEDAKSQKLKTQDVLRNNFEDQEVITGLTVALDKGVGDGLLDSRMAVGAKEGGPDAAMKTIADFATNSKGAGPARAAAANAVLGETIRGSKGSRQDSLYRDAMERMIADGRLDSSSANVSEYMHGLVPFSALGDRQSAIENEAFRGVVKRAPEGLVGREGLGGKKIKANLITDYEDNGYGFQPSHESRQKLFGETLDKIEAAGGTPLADAVAETNKLLNKQIELMQKAAPAGNAPPPLAPAPPVVRRP